MFSQNKKFKLAASVTLGATAFQLLAPVAAFAAGMPTPTMPAPTAFHALATPLQPAAKALAPVFHAPAAPLATPAHMAMPTAVFHAPASLAAPVHTILAAPKMAAPTLAPIFSSARAATPTTGGLRLPVISKAVTTITAPINASHVLSPSVSTAGGAPVTINHQLPSVINVVRSISAPITTGASVTNSGGAAAHLSGVIAPVIGSIASGNHAQGILAPVVGNIANGHLLNNVGNGSAGSVNILSGNTGHGTTATSGLGGIFGGVTGGGLANNLASGALHNTASGALGNVANGSFNNILTHGLNVNLATLAAPINAPLSVNAPISVGNGSPVGLSVLNSAVKDVSAAISPSNILSGTAISPALSQIEAPVSALSGGALPIEGNTLSIQSLPVTALNNLSGVNTGSTTFSGISGTTGSGNSVLPGLTTTVSNIIGGNSTTTPVSALNNLGGLTTGATSVTGTSGSTASGNGLLSGLTATAGDVLGGNTTTTPVSALNSLGGIVTGATSITGTSGSTGSGNGLVDGLTSTVGNVAGGNSTTTPTGILSGLSSLTSGATGATGTNGSGLSGLTSTATNLLSGATSSTSSTTTTGLLKDVTGILSAVLTGYTAGQSTGSTTTTTSAPPATTTSTHQPTQTTTTPSNTGNGSNNQAQALAAYYAALNPLSDGSALLNFNGVTQTVSPASYLQMLMSLYNQAIASGNTAFANALLFDIKQVNPTIANNLANGKSATGTPTTTASSGSKSTTGTSGSGTQTASTSGKGIQLNLGSSGIPGSNTLSLLGNVTNGAPVAVNFTPSSSPLNSSAALGSLKVPLLNLSGLTGH